MSLPKGLFMLNIQATQYISVQDQVWVDSIEEIHCLSDMYRQVFFLSLFHKESSVTTIFTVLGVGRSRRDSDCTGRCASVMCKFYTILCVEV